MNGDIMWAQIERLRVAGWKIEYNKLRELSLPADFLARYQNIPDDYLCFLEVVESCMNPSETTWFLCENDFNGTTDSAFSWNEFELQSLESSEGDEYLTRAINRFWRQHVPVVLSVKSGYSYLALDVGEYEYGRVVAGHEPEFEEVTRVCDSFSELLGLLSRAATESLPAELQLMV